MLSDDPWSLVESFPRRQGLSVPSRLETQPTRPQGSTETRSIGTKSPISLDHSVPCPVATMEPTTPETKSPWGFHRLVTMVLVDHGTLSHRVEMSLATLVHRRMGRQVPWPTSHLGTMVPRRILSHDAWLPGSLGTSTIELLEEYWIRGLAGPSVPRLCGHQGFEAAHGISAILGPRSCRALGPEVVRATWIQCLPWYMGPRRLQPPWSPMSHDHLGTKMPGHPAIKVPAITMSPSRQAAAGNSVPSCHRPPWSLALMGPSSARVPRSWPHQSPGGRMVPMRTISQGAREGWKSSRRWSIDRIDPSRIEASRSRQDLGTIGLDGRSVPGSHGPSGPSVPATT
jgi:hypothetical protein